MSYILFIAPRIAPTYKIGIAPLRAVLFVARSLGEGPEVSLESPRKVIWAVVSVKIDQVSVDSDFVICGMLLIVVSVDIPQTSQVSCRHSIFV